MPLDQPIKGIIGACLTPFGEDDHVDYEALEIEIDFLVSDCDAISIGADEASEYRMLTLEGRKELMRRATEMVAKRVPVIAGVSSPSPHTVIELADYAASTGADLVQVLMPLRPWGGQPSMAELVEYFTQVAAGCPLPIVAYHDPGPGADPAPDAFVRLSEINGVQYFKESSCDVSKIGRLIEQIELAGRGRYFATMQSLLTTLMMGASGAAMPPPATRIGAQISRAFRAGELERARYWQRGFALFPDKWAAYGLAPVMKSAMKHFGVDLGGPARPYAPVSPRDHAQIGQFLRQIGLLGEGIPTSADFDEAQASLSQEDTSPR